MNIFILKLCEGLCKIQLRRLTMTSDKVDNKLYQHYISFQCEIFRSCQSKRDTVYGNFFSAEHNLLNYRMRLLKL